MLCEKCVSLEIESIVKLTRKMVIPLKSFSYIYKWDDQGNIIGDKNPIVISKLYFECTNGHTFLEEEKVTL